MLIPYRVKNPVKTLPITTLSIITINVIVYLFTTEYCLQIREDVVNRYAFALGKTPFINVISAAFLHADPFHLIGNMLFLWVFGPSVEDRLGIGRYLLLYFITGLCGDFLQAAIDFSIDGEANLGIGASGCIMGILGAYWMLFSWSTVCVFYWIGWFWHGDWEVAAIWIIGLYMLMDLLQGVLLGVSRIGGGVAYFAHAGGAGAGILMVMLMKVKRDTEAVSEAKAIQADTQDLSMMPLYALKAMLEDDPQNPTLIRAIIKPALSENQPNLIHEAMVKAGAVMVEKDPEMVIYYLLTLKGNPAIYPPNQLLRLAGLKERSQEPGYSLQLYNLLVKTHPASPETELALYRMALCYWKSFNDTTNARACLDEMMKRFPNGSMLPYAWDLLRQMKRQ